MILKKLEEEIKKPELSDEEIKIFEKELENYRLTAELDNSLEFYGRPLKNQEEFEGYVVNDILGGVHWSLVDYCWKNKIIVKNRQKKWCVAADYVERQFNGGGICKTKAYNEFIEKWQGLEKLKERRLYANDMENERFGGDYSQRVRGLLEKTRATLEVNMKWGSSK